MARKQANKKRTPKKSARKSDVKKIAAKKKARGKPAAKKRAAKKAARKASAATRVTAGKASKAIAKKPAAKKAATKKKSAAKKSASKGRSIVPAPKPPGSPLKRETVPQGKTARSRLARKRALAGKLPPSRKMALRTSLARRPPQAARKRAEPAPLPFEPAGLGYRQAARHDWPAIRRILVEAFGRTDESDLVEALRASRDILAEFVAEHAGRTVAYLGFCALNASIDGRAFRAAGLAPLAVAGEVEGHGVGTRLTVYGLENVRGLGHDAVFVLGDPGFYGRFGFSARQATKFDSPWPGPHYQALEFEPGALRGEAGVTHWPEAFSLI